MSEDKSLDEIGMSSIPEGPPPEGPPVASIQYVAEQIEQAKREMTVTIDGTVSSAIEQMTVKLAGPVGPQDLQVFVPDGSPAGEMLSLLAFLINELGFVLHPPVTGKIPTHLVKFFKPPGK